MGIAPQNTESARIELFEYQAASHVPFVPDWQGWIETAEPYLAIAPSHESIKTPNETVVKAEFEQRLAEETRRSFEAGRERGRQAEHDALAASQKAADELRVRQRSELIAGFAQERDRYLHAVEQEVVKLALAIAARILRREAQMDPLLLTGAVRVAMGQLSGSTEVRLRVPPADLALWTDAIALLPNLAFKPTVVAAEGMRLGDCVVETSLGSVDLGVRSQLGEIERGFFDRAGTSVSGPAAHTDLVADATSETQP